MTDTALHGRALAGAVVQTGPARVRALAGAVVQTGPARVRTLAGAGTGTRLALQARFDMAVERGNKR